MSRLGVLLAVFSSAPGPSYLHVVRRPMDGSLSFFPLRPSPRLLSVGAVVLGRYAKATAPVHTHGCAVWAGRSALTVLCSFFGEGF